MVKKEALLTLNRNVSPDTLVLSVQSGKGELAAVGCLQEQSWRSLTSPQDLSPGKNVIALSGSSAACEQLKLSFDGNIVLFKGAQHADVRDAARRPTGKGEANAWVSDHFPFVICHLTFAIRHFNFRSRFAQRFVATCVQRTSLTI